MKIRAKKSFCGAFSMSPGEVRECNDVELLHDLIRAGYVEEVREPQPAPEKPAKAPAKKKTPAKRQVKADASK